MFSTDQRHRFIQKLTALWALNEAGLGGLMHALRIPFTGVFIGGTAVILITLIAYFARPDFKIILKSMVIVLVIKAVASPHSPINAYFAVMFQGIVGFLIFSLFKNLKIAAFLLALISLLEGAVQKVLVLTIIYGNSLWRAIDIFFDYILKRFFNLQAFFSASSWIIGIYFAIHLVGGIVVGILSIKFLNLMHHLPDQLPDLSAIASPENAAPLKSRKSKRKKAFKLAGVLIFILGSLTFFSSSNGYVQGAFVFLRVFALILIWYLFLGPFLLKHLHRFLSRKSKTYAREVEDIHQIFPDLKRLIFVLWAESSRYRYLKRWKYFLKNLILISLTFDGIQVETSQIHQNVEKS